MKFKTLIILSAIITSLISVSAQQKEKKVKKPKHNDQPKLTVVEVKEAPPIVPVAEVQKPTNGSLFTDNSPNSNLLRDFKARQIGDLIFVDVVESSTANVTSNAKRNRDSGNLAGLVPLVTALPISGAATAGPILGDLGQRKFEGKGTTGRTSSVRSRITARVIEVLPNGDMRIEAIKLVKINKETEQVAVTGIVRASDLASDNSIPTTFVGDLRVEFNGKGIASADNAPGWLFRFFDRVNPF